MTVGIRVVRLIFNSQPPFVRSLPTVPGGVVFQELTDVVQIVDSKIWNWKFPFLLKHVHVLYLTYRYSLEIEKKTSMKLVMFKKFFASEFT